MRRKNKVQFQLIFQHLPTRTYKKALVIRDTQGATPFKYLDTLCMFLQLCSLPEPHRPNMEK